MKYPNLFNWVLVLVGVTAVGHAFFQTFWGVTSPPSQSISVPRARTLDSPKPTSPAVSPSVQPASSRHLPQPEGPKTGAASAAAPSSGTTSAAGGETPPPAGRGVIRTDPGLSSRSQPPEPVSAPSSGRGEKRKLASPDRQISRSPQQHREIVDPSSTGRSSDKRDRTTDRSPTPPVRSSMPEQRPPR